MKWLGVSNVHQFWSVKDDILLQLSAKLSHSRFSKLYITFPSLVHFDGHLMKTDERGNQVKIRLANSKHPEAAPEVAGLKPIVPQSDCSQSFT